MLLSYEVVVLGFFVSDSGERVFLTFQAVAAVHAKLQGDLEGSKFWADKFASVADLCLPTHLFSCGSDEVRRIDLTTHETFIGLINPMNFMY